MHTRLIFPPQFYHTALMSERRSPRYIGNTWQPNRMPQALSHRWLTDFYAFAWVSARPVAVCSIPAAKLSYIQIRPNPFRLFIIWRWDSSDWRVHNLGHTPQPSCGCRIVNLAFVSIHPDGSGVFYDMHRHDFFLKVTTVICLHDPTQQVWPGQDIGGH